MYDQIYKRIDDKLDKSNAALLADILKALG